MAKRIDHYTMTTAHTATGYMQIVICASSLAHARKLYKLKTNKPDGYKLHLLRDADRFKFPWTIGAFVRVNYKYSADELSFINML